MILLFILLIAAKHWSIYIKIFENVEVLFISIVWFMLLIRNTRWLSGKHSRKKMLNSIINALYKSCTSILSRLCAAFLNRRNPHLAKHPRNIYTIWNTHAINYDLLKWYWKYFTLKGESAESINLDFKYSPSSTKDDNLRLWIEMK